MKKTIILFPLAVVFTIGTLFINACGNSAKENETNDQHQTLKGNLHHHDENVSGEEAEGMHQHMDIHADELSIADCPRWQDGEHEHSAYICPMWHEEGESVEPGDCQKCGMKLLKYTDVQALHDEQNVY